MVNSVGTVESHQGLKGRLFRLHLYARTNPTQPVKADVKRTFLLAFLLRVLAQGGISKEP